MSTTNAPAIINGSDPTIVPTNLLIINRTRQRVEIEKEFGFDIEIAEQNLRSIQKRSIDPKRINFQAILDDMGGEDRLSFLKQQKKILVDLQILLLLLKSFKAGKNLDIMDQWITLLKQNPGKSSMTFDGTILNRKGRESRFVVEVFLNQNDELVYDKKSLNQTFGCYTYAAIYGPPVVQKQVA